MKLVAPESGRLSGEPHKQRPTEATASKLGPSRQVVDVQEVAPREVVAFAKARHRCRVIAVAIERADQSVSLRPLHVVDAAYELGLVLDVRAQRSHREKRRARVGRQDLADVHG